jgi:hypothetical protein
MTDDLTRRLSAWSYRRQLLDGSGEAPLDALRSVVGVYSTHPTAPLALLARSPTLTPPQFQTLEQQRDAIRIVGMRGSAFLVPTDTAARIFSTTRMPAEQLGTVLRARGLDLESFARLTPRVLDCCQEPVTPAQLRSCAASSEDVYMVARVLARQGRVLRVGASLRTDQLKYVGTAAWLGHELEDVDASAAFTWLAGAYLRAFGPARVSDFAWWAGVPRRAAAAALSANKPVERGDLLVLPEDSDAFDACEALPAESVAILPKWDSYTMGYAPDGRQRFIDNRYLNRAYTSTASPGATSGDGLPLVLFGGQAVATWSHRLAAKQLVVSLQPFDGTAISDRAFDALGELLSAPSISVTTSA